MKMKSLFALVCGLLCAIAVNAKADGTINFFTFNSNLSFGQVYLPGTSTSVGSSFLGQLYVSSSLNGTYVAVGTPLAFQGGGAQPSAINSASPVTIASANGGDVYFYKLAAWDSAAGATFETAKVSGISGISGAVQVTLGGTPSGGGASLPAPQSNGFTSFQLAAVPEPTTIALGVMGGLALLARRRRNA
jgi:hypothetical protein